MSIRRQYFSSSTIDLPLLVCIGKIWRRCIYNCVWYLVEAFAAAGYNRHDVPQVM